MNLIFERVMPSDEEKIIKIYEIIKNSGNDMYINQGLIHWKTPYPIEMIKKNCLDREVFIAKDLDINRYIHTFQLEFSNILEKNNKIKKIVYLNKFATEPQYVGKGIGKLSLQYIEEYCKSKDVSKIYLDVYEKSEHAIRFYKNRGFEIIGQKSTKYFVVYIMEKQL